ncbi:probable cyclic nucleotide-gated ion channel 14 [Syzygium oleosum]|uniref:probable cyclic nucleotide-gated ion channel 14 n=1 Tax=Syzygium oleosum TaxID=219896 RepID=UPI0011D1FD27|nr:probable cyclic nucleotide-gated ion channel 14 [Syzygium oleosum]XP_056174665.1 probable cyclic nucleotide-gated ion channel 14 [Syzygium oleosum]XP_056174666.1 probable cyclic nucleotide-gated ion channel 14 [Syzygium oleosum]XP_056174667.1 probable cyclic nucleotide-gated ion channel 14 [Syzygium oleosum]
MDLKKKEKVVRFYNDGKQNLGVSWEKNDPTRLEKPLPLYSKIPAASTLLRPDVDPADRIKAIFEVPKFGRFKVFPENQEPWKRRILDPGSEIVLKWNRIFLFSCLVALFVDPLFFYLPSVVNGNSTSCLTTDLSLGIIVTFFRTLADAFYVLHVVVKFRTAYVAPSSRVFGRGELVMDPKKISRRYLRSEFWVDLFSALPLPQIVIWFIIPAIKSSHSDHTTNTLVLIVLLQYVPRLYLIFPLSSQLIKATGVVTKTAWAGAAYNLVLYMLASHVLGASWYLLSIERHATCLKSECDQELTPVKCVLHYLDCDTLDEGQRIIWGNITGVFSNCDPNGNITFQYGIFAKAFTENVVSSVFLEKYLYCLWWGLQNLSSYGQNLSTSLFIGETSFAILIAILGLVLFAHLIGNMQTYLQSLTVRLEEWRLKRRDTEEWMRHRQLPQDLRERVRRFVQYKWLATRGVDEESILHGLPVDLRRDIQRHLCLDLVRRVPFFSQMDDQLLDAICERLVSSLCTQGTYIVCEGDPVTEMLFIIRGRLDSSTTNGGRTGFFNSITLRPGDFCGEELLTWALLPKSSLNLPSSTRTVRALDEVEAFALRAEDLKFVANQFRRLHSKKLQHTFRFYSHHWRTWGACFIQAAWRRYKKRRLAKTLSMRESFSWAFEEHETLEDETEEHGEEEGDRSIASSASSQARQHLGVTILASRFAANTRRGAQKAKHVQLPKLLKPEEPDFSAEPDDE